MIKIMLVVRSHGSIGRRREVNAGWRSDFIIVRKYLIIIREHGNCSNYDKTCEEYLCSKSLMNHWRVSRWKFSGNRSGNVVQPLVSPLHAAKFHHLLKVFQIKFIGRAKKLNKSHLLLVRFIRSSLSNFLILNPANTIKKNRDFNSISRLIVITLE